MQAKDWFPKRQTNEILLKSPEVFLVTVYAQVEIQVIK